MAATLTLGAPGIYRVTDEPLRALTGVRMDVCAFVGVAPRGPSRLANLDADWAPTPCNPGQMVKRSVPVAVESWQAYLQSFGAFEGPGLLPYAVSAFFGNGGRRAYIVRIVHDYRRPDGSRDDVANAAGTARARLAGLSASGAREVWFAARNEGAWGNGLHARLSFVRQVLAIDSAGLLPDRIRLPRGLALAAGTTLRLGMRGGSTVLRRIAAIAEAWNPGSPVRENWALLDAPTATAAATVELVEGELAVDDGVNPTEVLTRLGLAANHPRWLARMLVEESALLWPADDPARLATDPLARWLDSDLVVDPALAPVDTEAFGGGANRYADIVADDFFDPDWVPGDECPGEGVHSLVDLDEVALLVAPDLYSPGPLAPIEAIVDPGGFAGAEFAECVTPPPAPAQATPPDDLLGLRLDPAADLDRIAELQQRLTTLADQLQSLIVLLDVPPGLSQRRILYWRGKFDCAYAAGYHPWIRIAPGEDPRQRPIAVNPAAIAAGIVAQREAQFGVAYGPANVVASGAIDVADAVSPLRHGELHQHAVNVYLLEREGVRLTAGRTLALDPTWRQLNVRRLVTMIRRVLERQMQWAVFEPNDRALRAQVARMLEAYLRQLYRGNAFTGATESEAFFVKCDDELNPPQRVDQGRLLAQVGIAPAEPMEFIVLNIARNADATLTVRA
jgi:hypothetical protein